MRIVAIIQARMNSSRLLGKCLADVAGEPVLARVVSRTAQAKLVNDLVVATSISPQDNPIVQLCQARGWHTFRGSEADVLDRYYQAALASTADVIVRITGDCPVICPAVVDQTITAFLENLPAADYASNCIPHRSYPRGLDVEVFSREALRRAWEGDSNPALREHVTPYLYLHPELFGLVGTKSGEDFSAVRLTVDTDEDLTQIRLLYQHFGPNGFSWRQAANYLRERKAVNGCVVQKPLISQLVLGTAQLGMNYGVANAVGKPQTPAAVELVKRCWELGVRQFDTAQAYGDSEWTLGFSLRALETSERPRITTKLHPKCDITDGRTIRRGIEFSRSRLGVDSLWAVLLHREEWLDGWPGKLGEALLELKEARLVEQLGVSVYSVDGALRALQIPEITVLQVPANVFDRRMYRTRIQEKATALHKILCIRSVYLQGLVCMARNSVPRSIRHGYEAVDRYTAFCKRHKLDRCAFAMDYVRYCFPEAMVVVGAETVEQAEGNCRLFLESCPIGELCEAWTAEWPDDHEGLVNPSLWREERP